MRHSSPPEGLITCVAVCGGSGSDLLEQAQRAGAQLFITSDVKYHRYFDADARCALVDVGHAESEQHTVELMIARISEKFRNFAVLGAETRTNPVTTS
jgi:putative NIF3 family GTP cyclohydrolase 1 type 2